MTYFAIDNVFVSRGPIGVLKGVTVEVKEKEIVSIIGANGAGKTTTLWSVVGLLRPTSGTIQFRGINITGFKPNAVLKEGIVLCPAERHVFPRMTVMENLMLGAFTRTSKKEITDDLERVFHFFPRLGERTHQLGATLSGGEQQMLAMARSVMGSPSLLLLDEPSLGLAPLMVRELGRLVRELNQDGTTVLLVEQNALLALEISQRTYVMELGEIVMHDRSSALAGQDSVRKAFLGE